MKPIYPLHPHLGWGIWAACVGFILIFWPSELTCLISVVSVAVPQTIWRIPWPALRWWMLLWIGFWANCYWEEDMYSWDALRFPALGWTLGLGAAQLIRGEGWKNLSIDAFVLGPLFTLNTFHSWDESVSMSRNSALFLVAIGLIGSGRGIRRDHLLLALELAWVVIVVQLLVTWAFRPDVAWIGKTSSRFQGFMSNPNSISHPLLLLSMVLIWARRNKPHVWGTVWSATAVILFISGTRAALLAFALFSAASLSLTGNFRLYKRQILGTLSVLGVALMAVIALTDWNWMRLESLKIGGGRFNAWPLAIDHALETPWLGQGAGYELQWFFAMSPYFEWLNHIGNSHNAFLAIFMDYGAIGGLWLLTWMALRFQWFHGPTWVVFAPALIVEMTFENWLTAPLSTSFLVMVATCMFLRKDDPLMT
jgi:hypothetical protein